MSIRPLKSISRSITVFRCDAWRWAGASVSSRDGAASGSTAAPAPAASPMPAAVLTSTPAPPPVLAAVPRFLRVTLRSVPPGVEVFRGRDRLGATPLEVEMEAGGETEYRFAHSGYRSLARRVQASEGVVEVRLARAEPRAGRELGAPAAAVENPYRKVDDLKPDPFQ